MERIVRSIRRFARDVRGAEVTELAIVLSLIVAGAVATIILLGPKIKQMFVDVDAVIP